MHKRIMTYIILAMCTLGLLTLPLDVFALDNNQSNGQQNWATIIIQLETAVANSPNNETIRSSLANAYNNYGLQFATQKQWAQAEAYLQKALSVNPSNDGIKHNLSNIYFEHGYELYNSDQDQNYDSYSHQESKDLANKALALYPNNINANLLLGDVEYMNQNMVEAQNAWQNAANIAPNNEQIQKRLAKITREAQTENKMNMRYNSFFIIKIDGDLENIPGFDISQALDTARIAVAGDFNYKQNRKIPVIVYTRDQYQSTLKDAPEWSDGAFDGKLRIILSKNSNNFNKVNSVIVHEYTHAVIADLTNNGCPRWINEGTAKYEEYKHGVAPIISVLALAYNTNNLLAWDKIDDAFLTNNPSEVLLAYEQSFSFVYYIVERFGMKSLVSLFSGLATKRDFAAVFQQVYSISLDTVQKDWRTWLNDYIPKWAEQPAVVNYQ